MAKRIDIPVADKYLLTVEEAAAYYNIGEEKLRRFANENKELDCFFWNGTRLLFKKNLLNRYIDKHDTI